ncbi:MAG: hypothetical protein ACM336_02430 [Acidobacteriota bacterium]
MSHYLFGDLQEWGRVLDQVRRLRQDGTLDQHQPELARLVRYPSNWQLRQAGLRAAAELKTAGDEVLRATVRVLADEEMDLDTRVLAGNAVSRMLGAADSRIGDAARAEAIGAIGDLLKKHQPPVLHECARRWQESLSEAGTVSERKGGGNCNAG